MEGRRAQFVEEVAAGEGLDARKASRRRRGDRPLGLVRRLGRQVRPGLRHGQPGGRAVLQLLGARADRRRRGGRAAGRRRCWAWSRWSRRSIVTGNTAVVLASEDAPAAGHHPGRGARHLRRARRGRQHPHRPGRRDRAVAGRPHGRQRHRPDRRAGGRLAARPARSRPPTTSSGSCGPAAEPTGPPTRASSGCSPSWRPRPSGTPSASDAGGPSAADSARRAARRPSRVGQDPPRGASRVCRCSTSTTSTRTAATTLPRHPTLGSDWDDPAGV